MLPCIHFALCQCCFTHQGEVSQILSLCWNDPMVVLLSNNCVEMIQGLCGDPIIVWKWSNVCVRRFLLKNPRVLFGGTWVTRQTLKKIRTWMRPSIEIRIAYPFSLLKDKSLLTKKFSMLIYCEFLYQP